MNYSSIEKQITVPAGTKRIDTVSNPVKDKYRTNM